MEGRRPRERKEDDGGWLFDTLLRREVPDDDAASERHTSSKVPAADEPIRNGEQRPATPSTQKERSFEQADERDSDAFTERGLADEAKRLELLIANRQAERLRDLSDVLPKDVRAEAEATIEALDDWEVELERGRFFYTHLRLRKPHHDGTLLLRFQLRRSRALPPPVVIERMVDDVLKSQDYDLSRQKSRRPKLPGRLLDQHDTVVIENSGRQECTIITSEGMKTVTMSPRLENSTLLDQADSGKLPGEESTAVRLDKEIALPEEHEEAVEVAKSQGEIPPDAEITALFAEVEEEQSASRDDIDLEPESWQELTPEADTHIHVSEQRVSTAPSVDVDSAANVGARLTRLAETLAEATEEIAEIPPLRGEAPQPRRRQDEQDEEDVLTKRPLTRKQPPQRESSRRPEFGFYDKNERYLHVERPPTQAMRRKARKLVKILARRFGLALTPELAAYLLEIVLRPQVSGGRRVWGLSLNRDELIRTLTVLWLQYGDAYGRRPIN